MRHRLGELADLVGGELRGDAQRWVEGVLPLETAGPQHLSFVAEARHLGRAESSQAGVLLVDEAVAAELAGRDLLVVADPSLALQTLLPALYPVPRPAPGVHPTAVVASEARVDPGASLGPYVVVGGGSEIGAETVLEAHVVVGRDCRVGKGCWLHPHAVLYAGTVLGDGVEIHAGAVLGADGFGYITREGVHHKLAQVGSVSLGDQVEVGANSTIDRATLGATSVGEGTKIDNLVQVGHNVTLGRACILCAQVGIAGSTRVGDGVYFGGRSGASGHLEVGDGVQMAGTAVALRSVPPGQKVAGVPAVDLKVWRRKVMLEARLPELFTRLKKVERRLDAAGADEEESL